MRHNPWKWLAIGGALTFLVIFGMEMSTTGIERIYGPIEGGENVTLESERIIHKTDTEQRIAQLERELEEIRKIAYGDDYLLKSGNPRLIGMPYETEQPAVNKLADTTSSLLQSASSKGIRFVVSLFDGWIH